MAKVVVKIPDVWGNNKDVDGTIINWFYDEGARVSQGTVIAEGMVEKVTFEVTAPVAGTLSKILSKVDEPIRVGSRVAEIESD
ncbi:MAG: lipoyl domain-containing protein [Thermaceae bacterium]|nr:lipoyl domain-containing protein [Thermaceae bacterium]